MKQRVYRKWGSRALVVLMLGSVLGGCGLAKRPAPATEQEIPPGPSVTAPARTMTAAIYFADWQVQHLIPEARQVSEAEGAALATEVVRELLKGPSQAHLGRPIPAGTELLEPVTIQDGVAYVNLSRHVGNLQGTAAVQMLIGSLRLTLTEVPGVEKVQLLIEGRKESTLGGILLEPMDRGLYVYPVLVDAERIGYLQARYDQGLETWRSDPVRVAQWEGRMFGFTASDLETAQIEQSGVTADVKVTHDGDTYTIRLAQNEPAPGKVGIWTIKLIEER